MTAAVYYITRICSRGQIVDAAIVCEMYSQLAVVTQRHSNINLLLFLLAGFSLQPRLWLL